VYGRSRIAYRFGQTLGFPVKVDAPRPIRRGVVQVVVKDSETLEVLDHKKWVVKDVKPGSLLDVVRLPWARLTSLKSGEDYLVAVSLSWKNKSGARVGTCREMLITLVGAYCFDRVEQSGDLLYLDDPTTHREFWHKVWAVTFNEGLKHVIFDARYYYTLEGDRTAIARMKTLTQTQKTGLKREAGKLKSGMILSPDALKNLISRLPASAAGPSQTTTPDDEVMAALRTPDFEDRFSQVAQATLDFRGRDGENAALWVYPVVKLQRVVMKKVETVDQNGNVSGMSEQSFLFPMPVMAQFVGLSSER
jgi:hypothetical protein